MPSIGFVTRFDMEALVVYSKEFGCDLEPAAQARVALHATICGEGLTQMFLWQTVPNADEAGVKKTGSYLAFV